MDGFRLYYLLVEVQMPDGTWRRDRWFRMGHTVNEAITALENYLKGARVIPVNCKASE